MPVSVWRPNSAQPSLFNIGQYQPRLYPIVACARNWIGAVFLRPFLWASLFYLLHLSGFSMEYEWAHLCNLISPGPMSICMWVLLLSLTRLCCYCSQQILLCLVVSFAHCAIQLSWFYYSYLVNKMMILDRQCLGWSISLFGIDPNQALGEDIQAAINDSISRSMQILTLVSYDPGMKLFMT